MNQHNHEKHEHHWLRARRVREIYGITAPQLARWAGEGMIRTSHIRRTGQTRGVRLYNLGDIAALIEKSIEPPNIELR